MNSLKELNEKREKKMDEMSLILEAAKNESRALSEEENEKFSKLEKEITDIDKSIDAENRAVELSVKKGLGSNKTKEEPKTEELEERAFAEAIRRGDFETRTGEINFTKGNNGAIIPQSIASRIITKIVELSPIVEKATRYNVPGKLIIPSYGPDGNNDISVNFYDEFDETVANAGKFDKIELGDYIAMALTLVSKELINNDAFDVVSFIVNQVAKKIAIFLENQLINGTSGKTQGAVSSANTLTALAANAVAVDDLIKLQSMVKTSYQKNACWTMHRKTFTSICMLKDGNQRPLVMPDYSTTFPYVMLGKPVYISDNMPEVANGAKSIIYGDYSAMALKFSQNIEVQVLREKYITQHAIGIHVSMEIDCKVQDAQGLAVLVQPS
ncbi:MAG: phage major capsid protein [Lachnospiraceae bacterium]|nr:phage major capsid protein [Lachnospiraceae bacterium]